MDTVEMRLLTVPQFARRVSRSVDEVLALIANRDVKALRPDPEGGYRVLETEVDRWLQEKTTRIRPTAPKSKPSDQAAPARTVPMEAHLTTVTALETTRAENARLERLNSTLQAELFQYRRLCDENNSDLHQIRARLEETQQQLCAAAVENERHRLQNEQRLALELDAADQAQAAEWVSPPKGWWQRLFG